MSMQIAVNVLSATLAQAVSENAGLDINAAIASAIGGLGNARCLIKSIKIVSEENLTWDLLFFGSATHGATYDTDTYLGHYVFQSSGAIQYSNDPLSGAWRYFVPDVDLPYQDLDAEQPQPYAPRLHMTLVPRSADHVVNKKVVITVYIAPEVPWSGA